jgi:hypothetical protein
VIHDMYVCPNVLFNHLLHPVQYKKVIECFLCTVKCGKVEIFGNNSNKSKLLSQRN